MALKQFGQFPSLLYQARNPFRMKNDLNRRRFLKSAIASSAGIGLATSAEGFNILPSYPVKDKYNIAIMGLNSRGGEHASGFAKQVKANVAYICDVDERAVASGIEKVMKAGQKTKPKGIADFRQALDDKSLDVLTIAAPDHWHAPAAILGLKAGKHIYVEKPGSHNPAEGELLITVTPRWGYWPGLLCKGLVYQYASYDRDRERNSHSVVAKL
jgi:hypothetical protein